MKPKLHPIYLIVGLFLFKVGIIDSFRNLGSHNPTSRYASTEAPVNNLRPIR